MATIYKCSFCGNVIEPEFTDGEHCPHCRRELSGIREAVSVERVGCLCFVSAFLFGGIGDLIGGDKIAVLGVFVGILVPIIVFALLEKRKNK